MFIFSFDLLLPRSFHPSLHGSSQPDQTHRERFGCAQPVSLLPSLEYLLTSDLALQNWGFRGERDITSAQIFNFFLLLFSAPISPCAPQVGLTATNCCSHFAACPFLHQMLMLWAMNMPNLVLKQGRNGGRQTQLCHQHTPACGDKHLLAWALRLYYSAVS